MTQILGIDLGTTNSLCALFESGQPQLIRNAHNQVLTPSVVGVLPDGQVVVGAPANELRITQPDRCGACFKRYMGTDRKLQLADKTFSAVELSSLVLRSLKQDAEAHVGRTLSDAVITVPAYFNDNQRKATKMAGELAGLHVRRIINEPTAAALTYGFHDREAEKKLIVIDLGGGTFDVTVMEIFEGTLEIISTAGESFLGGEDFTDRLTAAVLRQLGLQLETAELKQPLRVARLRQECERVKRELLTQAAGKVRVPHENGELNDNCQRVKLTREQFAKLSGKLMQRITAPIDKALRDASCDLDEIEDVILVGGATRMPLIREFVETYFRKKPICDLNPDEVVALGAAVQSALIDDDRAVDDMVMTDVCPFTLGVEVAKQFGNQIMEGYYTPVIHRNTTIPVSREEQFSTLRSNQTEIEIRIYQGESRKVKDNLCLGELTVTGIPPSAEPTPFLCRFTYDINGILEVEAYLPSTGQKVSTVLTQHARSLSDHELEEAVERMQQIKFYPRDQVENQNLLLFVERVVGEVNPMHRQQLEEAIDGFEAAMASGDREVFQSMRDHLLLMLSQLGFVYNEDQDVIDHD